MKRCFRSAFIVDVTIEDAIVTLMDSVKNRYFIDLKDDSVKNQFKTWFSNVFSKGISQTVTVFQYENRGEDPDFELFIVKFIFNDNKLINESKNV